MDDSIQILLSLFHYCHYTLVGWLLDQRGVVGWYVQERKGHISNYDRSVLMMFKYFNKCVFHFVINTRRVSVFDILNYTSIGTFSLVTRLRQVSSLDQYCFFMLKRESIRYI